MQRAYPDLTSCASFRCFESGPSASRRAVRIANEPALRAGCVGLMRMNSRVSGLGRTSFGAGLGLIGWARGVVTGVEAAIWAYVGGTEVLGSLGLGTGLAVGTVCPSKAGIV